VPAPIRATPESTPECLPKATLPLPSCVAPEDIREHALVTLQRAGAWLRAEEFATAAERLSKDLHSIERSRDVGLVVRSHSLLGEAWLGLSRFSAAEEQLRAASRLWASTAALSWIRSLPAGEASQRSIQLASDAASRAVLRLAELHSRNASMAPPRFAQGESPQPFGSRRDSELNGTERALRSAWKNRQQTAFVRYLWEDVAPWVRHQRTELEAAERELQQVYLVPPVTGPEWRVAVAADIGSLWNRFAERQRAIERSCGVACDGLLSFYGNLGDSWEPDLRRARNAFDACLALSRKYRLLTAYTLVCEHGLARSFQREHARLDELVPTAHWGAP
jgi:hypothetical protein